MDYLQKLKYHFQSANGWINDPNGLVYFKGYYHLFFQHAPGSETPKQPMHWGHARTKNFIDWEELPIALYPDKGYDADGCWSGTATVKDDTLYLFYASIHGEEQIQTVSIAYSTDGISFEKYENNPVISTYPSDGSHDFRDPAVCRVGEEYYCVMATGYPENNSGRLLLYKSHDIFNWEYCSVIAEWENYRFAECPSLVEADNGKYLLTASVYRNENTHSFSVMYGEFKNGGFDIQYSGQPDKGPDLYAGQVFRDHLGRNILMSWIPGWTYAGFAEKDIGCMSVPKELKLKNGEIYAYPIDELKGLLKSSDPAVKITESGFIIERKGRSPVVYNGKITDLKIIRDGYIIEVFVNGGKEVYSAVL